MDARQALIKALSMSIPFTLAMIPVLYYYIKKANAKDQDLFVEVKVLKRYNFYLQFSYFRKKINHILMRYRALGCLSETQLKVYSTKKFEKSFLISVAIPFVLTFATGNLILGLFGILVSKVYYVTAIDKEIDRLYDEIIKEVSELILSINLNYLETHNVPRSVMDAKKGYYLTPYVNSIYDILTSTDNYNKLKTFISKSPLKVLCELAEVCQVTHEYGDYKDSKGNYKFIEQLSILNAEVNLDIRLRNYQRLKFKWLDVICLVSVGLMPLAESYLLNNIPGTAILLKGVYGLSIKVIILLITASAYYYVTSLTKTSVVASNDCSETVYKLSQRRRVMEVVKALKPKNYKQVQKLKELFESSLTSHTTETFYTEKLLNFIIYSLTFTVLSVLFVFMSRTYIYKSTVTFSLLPTTMSKETLEDIRLMDEDYMNLPDEERPTGEELISYVEGSLKGVSPLEIQSNAERLEQKYKIYKGIRYKVFYPILAYIAGILGWFIPNIKMKLRKSLVRHEAEADASQLNTVMISISGTGMSVYEVLYRLMDLSTIHKTVLSYCTQIYTRDPEHSLNWLYFISSVDEFKSMVTKLGRSIYNISIKDAFADTAVEKENALASKEDNSRDKIVYQANAAKLVSMLPIGLTFVLMVMAPIVILGFNNLSKVTTTLGGM